MVNVFSAIAFASVALVASVSAGEDDVRHLQAVNFRQEMLDAVNAVRKKEGLDEVCINELLMNAAQVQANDMAENNFIKSTGSDGSVPKERATAEGFKAAQVTEVVGAGYRSATTIVSAWAKAASAKSTVLSKHTVMGPGYTFDKTKKYVHFWAVDFSDGECGNGTATAPAAGGSTSGSGSVDLPTSSSGSAEAPASASGSAPASASAAETSASASAAETSTSASAAEASTSASAAETSTSASAAETPASGSAAETPASGSAAETPASGSAAETPASGSAAETPASGSAAETPASGSGEEAPASETSSASAEETEAPDTPNQ